MSQTRSVLGRFMELRAVKARKRSEAVWAVIHHLTELDEGDHRLTAINVLQLANRYRSMLNERQKVPGADRDELEDLRKVIDILDAIHHALQV